MIYGNSLQRLHRWQWPSSKRSVSREAVPNISGAAVCRRNRRIIPPTPLRLHFFAANSSDCISAQTSRDARQSSASIQPPMRPTHAGTVGRKFYARNQVPRLILGFTLSTLYCWG